MGDTKNADRVVYRGGSGEITEKKSRFIATIRPVRTEEAAASFIGEMKKKYWDARHNCSAFVLGERQELTRCSDDGEPPQTAGRPMLDVLLGEGIHNAAVVVTRYFGGVLLGTGGLVRAYQSAVRKGLDACEILDKYRGKCLTIKTDYSGIGKLQYLFEQQKLAVLSIDYGADVTARILVPTGQQEATRKMITEQTRGAARLDWGEEQTYGIYNKEVILLDEK